MYCGPKIFKAYQTLFSKTLTPEENSFLYNIGTTVHYDLTLIATDVILSALQQDEKIKETFMVFKEINKNDSIAIQNINYLFSELIDNPISERSVAASSVPVEPEPPKPKFFPLISSLRNTTIRASINPKIKIIECLSQENSSVSCGAHSLKNAMLALGISGGWITEDEFSFVDKKFYKEVNSFIRIESNDKKDLTEEHLRGAWIDADMNQFFCPSRKGPSSQNEAWDYKMKYAELSFFQTGNTGLTIQDADGLYSLLNLKALIQKPAPCYHAFIIGHRGHWSTLFFEKDHEGIITWYEIDSLENVRGTTRAYKLVEWIEEAMDNIDHLSLQLHDRYLGELFRKYVAQMKKEGCLEVDGKIDLLDSIFESIHFMKQQGWLINPPQNLIIAETLNNINTLLAYHREHQIEEIETTCLQEMISHIDTTFFPSFSPIDLEIELFKVSLPFGESADSLLSEFLQLPDEAIPKLEFLHFLNKNCAIDEKADQLKLAIFLFNFGYAPLFHRAFTNAPTEEREENWKILVDLHFLGLISLKEDPVLVECKRILNNEHVHAQSSSSSFASSLEAINPFLRQEQHLQWLNGHLESIQNNLFSESNPHLARRKAQGIINRQFLFFPDKQEDKKLTELVQIAQLTIDRTAENELQNFFNPWNLYEYLKLYSTHQNPIQYFFQYEGKYFEFKPSTFIPQNYTRADLSPRAHPQTVKTLFDNLAARIESNPRLAIEAMNASGEVEFQNQFSNDEELELIHGQANRYVTEKAVKKFKDFKNRFFQDSVIASFMEIPEDINSEISEETYLFYALMEECLNRNSIPSNPNTLSDQEQYFYYFCNAIEGCPTGKRIKIRSLFQMYLSKSSQNVEGRGSRHPIFNFFLPLYDAPGGFQKRVENLFSNVNFAREDLHPNYFSGQDITHYEELMRNMLSHRLGLKRQVTFDWHTHLIIQHFFNWCQKVYNGQGLSYISGYISRGLPVLLGEVSAELNGTLLINARLVQVVNRYNKARSQYVLGLIDESQFREVKMQFLEEKSRTEEFFENGSLWTQIEAVPLTSPAEGETEGPEHREPKYRIENLYEAILDLTKEMKIPVTDLFKFEYDEEAVEGEDMKLVGIKKEALTIIAEALGVLLQPSRKKLTVEPGLSEQALQDLIQKNRYITDLDLSRLEGQIESILTILEDLPHLINLKKINLSNLTFVDRQTVQELIKTKSGCEIDVRGCKNINKLNIDVTCKNKIIYNKNELEITLELDSFDVEAINSALKINPDCKLKLLWDETKPLPEEINQSIERMKEANPSLEITIKKLNPRLFNAI